MYTLTVEGTLDHLQAVTEEAHKLVAG